MASAIRESLTLYLRKEGFSTLLSEPEDTIRKLLTAPIICIWAGSLWISPIILAILNKGLSLLWVVAISPPFLFFLIFIFLIAVLLVRKKQGKELEIDQINRWLPWIILVYFPDVLFVLFSIYMKSFSLGVTYSVIYALSMVFLATVVIYPTQAMRLGEALRAVFRAFTQSLHFASILMPTLLIITLLSVFSEELWFLVGNLSGERIILFTIFTVAPVVFLVLKSKKKELQAIVHHWPENEHLIELIEKLPFLSKELESGHISPEELEASERDMSWRIMAFQRRVLEKLIQGKVEILWLGGLTCTGLVLLVLFFIYWIALFSIIMNTQVIETWIQIEAMERVAILSSLFPFSYSGAVAMTKVSIVLALFTSISFCVYAITDDSIKTSYTDWLRDYVDAWRAAGALYLCIDSPNYQVLEYLVNEPKQGRVNVSILVPRGLQTADVEKACEHMATRLKNYDHLIIVTAFEQRQEDNPIYKRGYPGIRWELLYNKKKDIRRFGDASLIVTELRYNHHLGNELLEASEEIPEEWFGDTPRAITIAKALLEEDISHEWILHPFVFDSGHLVAPEICLKKRMQKSDDYRMLVTKVFDKTRSVLSPDIVIQITITYRDTLDILAELTWGEKLPYVQYKDECLGKSLMEAPERWGIIDIDS